MKIPEKVNAQWLDTLGNDQLIKAEATLHAEFSKQETAQKLKCGTRYTMLEGPTDLVNAWLRWALANNETRARGLLVHHVSSVRKRRALA
jgi:hypothetical protein